MVAEARAAGIHHPTPRVTHTAHPSGVDQRPGGAHVGQHDVDDAAVRVGRGMVFVPAARAQARINTRALAHEPPHFSLDMRTEKVALDGADARRGAGGHHVDAEDRAAAGRIRGATTSTSGAAVGTCAISTVSTAEASPAEASPAVNPPNPTSCPHPRRRNPTPTPRRITEVDDVGARNEEAMTGIDIEKLVRGAGLEEIQLGLAGVGVALLAVEPPGRGGGAGAGSRWWWERGMLRVGGPGEVRFRREE